MATVLNDHSMEEMDKFYEENGTTREAISKNEEATQMWIEMLKCSGRRDDILPFEWISWMLEQAPNDRPTADQLLGRILDTKSNHAFLCSHCLADAHSSQAESIVEFVQPETTEPKPDQNDNESIERTESRNVKLEGPGEYVDRSETKASSRPLSNVATGGSAQGNES